MSGYPTSFIFGPWDACLGQFSNVLFLAFSWVGLLLFFVQVFPLQQLQLVPVYLLPLLTFCITYENVVSTTRAMLGWGLEASTAQPSARATSSWL